MRRVLRIRPSPSRCAITAEQRTAVSISIFLTGPGISTLPIQLLAHMEQFFDPTVASVSVLLMVLTVAVMAIVERTLGLTFLAK